MEKLTIDQMENLVGGSDYCDNLWIMLNGGNYQGDVLAGWALYDRHCVDDIP
jgi:hypothetical protein